MPIEDLIKTHNEFIATAPADMARLSPTWLFIHFKVWLRVIASMLLGTYDVVSSNTIIIVSMVGISVSIFYALLTAKIIFIRSSIPARLLQFFPITSVPISWILVLLCMGFFPDWRLFLCGVLIILWPVGCTLAAMFLGFHKLNFTSGQVLRVSGILTMVLWTFLIFVGVFFVWWVCGYHPSQDLMLWELPEE